MQFYWKSWLKIPAYLLMFLIGIVIFYGVFGWFEARKDAGELQQIAQEMRDNSLGLDELGQDASGENRSTLIIKVEDPNFFKHSGYDFNTAGAGATTITQSLSKQLAFENFKPGYQKIRQTGYAIGLESALNKEDIFTLFLNTVQMGRFPTGWIEGFHRASKLHFRKPASEISDDEFIELIAVMIAPSELRLDEPSDKRDERVKRIKRYLKGECAPINNSDVWLDGCAS